MRKIRIGQIGIRHEHAPGRMEALRALPDLFEVVGIVVEKPDLRTGTHSPDAYAGVPVMTEEELLSHPGLEAVAVETDVFHLVPTAMRCARRGFHIHLDKPAGEEMEPFAQLVELAREGRLILQLSYMYRTNPAVLFAISAVRNGWIGDLFHFEAVMNSHHGDTYREYLAGYRGGALFNFGSHLIDLAVALLGAPKGVHSFQTQTRGDGLCDSGLAVLQYPKATATIRAAITEVDGMKHRRLQFCGTKGTIEICPIEPPPRRYRLESLKVRLTLLESNPEYPAGTHIVDVGCMNGRYEDQLVEFARSIRSEVTPTYSYDHDLVVQRIILQAAGY